MRCTGMGDRVELFQRMFPYTDVGLCMVFLCLTVATAISVTEAAPQTSTEGKSGKLTGQMSFTKKPPKVALVYFSEDTGLDLDVTVDQQGQAVRHLSGGGLARTADRVQELGQHRAQHLRRRFRSLG